MSNRVVKNLKVDDRMDSYNPFYDGQWTKMLAEKAGNSPVLESLVYHFCLSVKGVSTTFAIPKLSIDMAENFANKSKLLSLENSLSLRIVNSIVARIDQSTVLHDFQRESIRAEMLKMSEEVQRNTEGISLPFPRQKLWDSFAKVEENEDINTYKNEFRLVLWAACRLCYSALIFAYEDFVVQCMRIKAKQTIRVGRKFSNKCVEILGSDLTKQCWDDPQLAIARLVRNSLAHAGGRETLELRQRPHDFDIIDGELQILPVDILELHQLIKKRANTLVEWAVDQPEFQ